MGGPILGAAGLAIGGPFGALLGAQIGRTAENALRARGSMPAVRIQQSSYGEPIPSLFGSVRIAGTLIWALPFSSHVNSVSRGKAYTTSFALGLSARAIRGIGRIWADGSELRNSSGEFDGPQLKMRVYTGQNQDVIDPIISAVEGAGYSPSYRKLCYVVFEDFPIFRFGNRIPNLNFEVIADYPDDVEKNTIEYLYNLRNIKLLDVPEKKGIFLGYICKSNDIEKETLNINNILDINFSTSGGKIVYKKEKIIYSINKKDLINDDSLPSDPSPIWTKSKFKNRRSVSVTYLDADRDYLESTQFYGDINVDENNEIFPMVTNAHGAQKYLSSEFKKLNSSVITSSFKLSFKWISIEIGDSIFLADLGEYWTVTNKLISAWTVTYACSLESSSIEGYVMAGDAGRVLSNPARPGVAPIVAAFEPVIPLSGQAGPAVCVTASGGVAGRPADIYINKDGDEAYVGAAICDGTTIALLETLEKGPSTVWDNKNKIKIRVDGEIPASASENAVLNGSNIIMIGDEILQYKDVSNFGDGIFELSGLLRGRYATEYAIKSWDPGVDIRIISNKNRTETDIGSDYVDRDFEILVPSAVEYDGVDVVRYTVTGSGFAPLSPVLIKSKIDTGKNIKILWVDRDRKYFDWYYIGQDENKTFVVCVTAESRKLYLESKEREVTLTSTQQIQSFGKLLTDYSYQIWEKSNYNKIFSNSPLQYVVISERG
jgi:hypothetical protein